MVWYSVIISMFLYIWSLFILWIKTIFVVPIQTTEMLWILVPIWIAWFFAEFFQEKLGTSLGNAISNAVIIVWGSIDCTRKTFELIHSATITAFWDIFSRFAIITFIFLYGSMIVFLGWKGNKVIRYLGRIRMITYIFIMFVPVLYNDVVLSFDLIFSAILFFPLFYFTIELIDKYTPDPKALTEDKEGEDKEKSSFSSSNPLSQSQDPFSSQNNSQNYNFPNSTSAFQNNKVFNSYGQNQNNQNPPRNPPF